MLVVFKKIETSINLIFYASREILTNNSKIPIKYNDLYRDLEYHNIREPDVRLILVNEQHGAQYLPGIYYGKIRLFQDNYKDQFIEKLGLHGHRLNNLIFGRCGDLVYTQRYPQSNIEEETNYQQLLRIIMTVAKNKQACHKMCG
ncbi:unnamed protein product [Rotaria sordida]|uniref:Uncharacterized protein n=1 Tax=Rotaria sordida TaxID=392033 RepID=A0A814PUF0_9BILA|nr:unnamed protein product [Rotaria sordida]